MKQLLIFLPAVLFIVRSPAQTAEETLFSKMPAASTGIDFVNRITESDSLHVMKYEYLYNGHGVGVADFNGDGLVDLFFSGNTVPSRLYLNEGNFRFRDVTSQSGIHYNGTWATGVSIADVNGDGLPDIYVCHSGSFSDPRQLANELLINQGIKKGVPVFAEMASAYKLDAPGTQSTQALFFDYDRDGDLDMFLLNHSNHTYNPFLNTRKVRSTPDMRFGNRLFRNDRDSSGKMKFTDVTLSAGIINNALNFGLSVTASDINGDGWPDLYTTSDYTEKDCLYINNKNGSFSEQIESSMSHISKYSMGSDIADYNNDGRPDVLTLDMMPEDNHRQKLLKGPDEYDEYHMLLDSGYYHQQMRNMLQLNEGTDEKGHARFSEIGQLAGISNTDWSWAGLFADFDNDGWKDLFISNGYLRDFTDMDFLKYTVSNAQLEEAKKGNLNFKTFRLVSQMPSNKTSSYIFRNSADLRFKDVTREWGLYDPAVSNGAAYADLDNDGDLDLIICRNNEPVALYKNNASQRKGNHYCRIRLLGNAPNTAALGAKIYVYANGNRQMQEQFHVRGYQSSVSDELLFGLGSANKADSLIIAWPDGTLSRLNNASADSSYIFRQADAKAIPNNSGQPKEKLFTDITETSGLDFVHKENDFIDFKDEVLLPYQLSCEGPALARADVNGDGLEDIFIGGAIEQPAVLFIQDGRGGFIRSASQPWTMDAASEDVNAIFFDANGDKAPDLYVVSGGNEYGDGSPEFADRLYMNDGKGDFQKLLNGLPAMLSNKQAVAAGDFDHDGDEDLFVGGRGIPGSFPLPSRSYILRNDSKDGKIIFTDVTDEVGKALEYPGMVTAASWQDLDKDGYPELMIAGDWMPVMLFKNEAGRLSDISANAGLMHSSGMWSVMYPADIDSDGDMDFVLGNAGTNLQFHATASQPMELYFSDFDNNGRIDPLTCYYIQGKSYPMASRDELLDQVTALKKKFIYYKDFADARITDIFTRKQLDKAKMLVCEKLESTVLINNGNMSFGFQPLPAPAQFSKINGIAFSDINGDGIKDLLLGGNFFPYRTQLGRNDAGLGVFLKGIKGGSFEAVSASESGLYAGGDVRGIELVKTPSGNCLVIAKNNDHLQAEKIR